MFINLSSICSVPPASKTHFSSLLRLSELFFVIIAFFKMFLCLALVSSSLLPYKVYAHETETSDSIPFERIYAEVLEKASRLAFQQVPENSPSFEAYLRGSKKYGLVGPREYVKVDNAFYDLTNSIGKLFLQEFEKACEECILPSLDSLNDQVEALVAKGWLGENSKRAKEILAYRFASAFVSLGGRYGKTAGAIKLAGELVEEAVLWIFHLPGMHVVCEYITAMITVFAGKANTLYRAFADDLAKYSHISGPFPTISSISRLLGTTLIMRRAMARMAIGVRPFDIDEEKLREFVDEEKETKLSYRITKRHRVDKFLRFLQKKAEEKVTKVGQDEAIYFHEMRRKIYAGGRYLFILNHRKRFNSVGQFADESGKLTNGNRSFWLVGLKNDVLDPLTDTKQLKSDLEDRVKMTERLSMDSITEKQVTAYSTSNSEGAEAIFRSLDAITDNENKTFKQRRIDLGFFQSYISGVVPKLLNKMLVSVLDQFEDDKKRIMPIYDLFFKEGSITYYAEQFIDFLRFASIAEETTDPFIKYHVRDYYLKLNESLNIVSQFNGARSVEDIEAINELLKEKLKDLRASMFWIDKPSHVGFLPQSVANFKDFLFHPIKHPTQKIKDRWTYYKDVYDFGRANLMNKDESYKRPRYQTGAPACESLYL